MAYTTAPAGSATAAATYQELAGSAGTWAFVLGIRDGRTSAATTVGIERKGLQRATGGTVSLTLTPGLFLTRSPAATITVNKTWTAAPTASGVMLVWLSTTEKHEAVYQWRPPRPWAAPQITDAEQIDLLGTNAANVATFFFSQGPPPPTRRLARRPRRNGLWHYRNEHRTYTHSASSPAYDINRPVSTNWVARVPPARPLQPSAQAVRNAGTIVLLQGTLVANPAIIGAISRSRTLAGTLVAAPALSGSVSRAIAFAGTLVATPAINGTMSRARALTGILSANPALSGVMSRSRQLAGTLVANPAIIGTLSRSRALVATLIASPAITGSLRRSRQLAGILSATPAITGSLSRARQLSATLTAAPSIIGTLSLSGAIHLAGTLAASPAITGTLTRSRQLGGVLTASPGMTGALSRSRQLLGILAGNPAISGVLRVIHAIIEAGGITLTFPPREMPPLVLEPKSLNLAFTAPDSRTLSMANQERVLRFDPPIRTLIMS